MLLLCATPAHAHKLDEYLQASTISLESGRIGIQMRLTAGVAVVPVILRRIDANADGVISDDERHAYGEAVLRDVSLRVDGAAVGLRLLSWTFPNLDEMKEGRGEIRLELAAAVPRTNGRRRIVFENQHHKAIGAYLVNSLVPRETGLRIAAQHRDYEQSFYQVDVVRTTDGSSAKPLASVRQRVEWAAGALLLMFVGLRSRW